MEKWRDAEAHQTAPWSGRFCSTRPILHFLRHSVRSAARPHFVRPRRLLFEAPSCSMLGREKIVRETISPRWPTANAPGHTCAHYLPDRHSFGVSYIFQQQRIVCPDYQKLRVWSWHVVSPGSVQHLPTRFRHRGYLPFQRTDHTNSNSRELYLTYHTYSNDRELYMWTVLASRSADRYGARRESTALAGVQRPHANELRSGTVARHTNQYLRTEIRVENL